MIDDIVCTFLGTCARDFEALEKADCRGRFDKDARRSSCLLIGDSLLVDCGTHVLDSLAIAGADISKITDIFVTHFHDDHFNPEHAERIAEGKTSPVRLWCRFDAEVPPLRGVEVMRMHEGVKYPVFPTLNAISVYANHDETSFPNHFLFEVNGKKLFYGTDGAWMTERACVCLRGADVDVFITDATCGDYAGDSRATGHNSIPMIRLLLPSLRANGIISDKTRVMLTHIAPSLHKPHDETVKLLRPEGLIVAYDGMRFTL